jgi:hypothetical protein
VALALTGAALGAYFALAGEGDGEEGAAARATPTPEATYARLTPTPIPDPGPADAPPQPPAVEGGQAPKGCLSTELAYVDPAGRFAFCYPKDMKLLTTDEGHNGTGAIVRHPISDRDRVVATFGWNLYRSSVTGDPCIAAESLIVKNQTVADYSLSGKTVPTCFQDRYALKQPQVIEDKVVRMEVPAAGGGFVAVFLAYGGPDFQRDGLPVEDIALRFLDSVVIY